MNLLWRRHELLITSSLFYQESGVKSQESEVSFYLFSPSPQPPTDYWLLIPDHWKAAPILFQQDGERLRQFQQGLTSGDINLSAILGDNDTKLQDDSALGNNQGIGGKDKWLSPDRLEFY